MALFFGFSAAMLGISAFEPSANFVEEQADGVFPKIMCLAKEWNIPMNLMFIGSPTGDRMKHRLEDFGGVRLII